MTRNPAAKVSRQWLCLGGLMAALLFAPSVAFANDTPVATAGGEIGAMGGTVTPVWTTDVSLAAETVQAVCFGDFAEYRVDFRFVNEGKRRKVKLGFPFADTDSWAGGPFTTRPIGFQAWQNGQPLTVRAVPSRGPGGSGWRKGYFVHQAVFPHGATIVTVSYLVEVAGSHEGRRRHIDSHDPRAGEARAYDYWLHTGSPWKGTIGKSVVRYRFADSFRGRDIGLTAANARKDASLTTPSGWSRPLARTVQWEFTDFEPTPRTSQDWWFRPQSPYDVVLAFSDKGGPKRVSRTWAGSSAVNTPTHEHNYHSLQDGALSTCWIEGAQGSGVGEWVEKQFGHPVRLRELRILPGNNAYDSAFTRYGRPKTLRAVFSDGSFKVLRFRDAPALQRFPVHVTTRSVCFVIESVYDGTDYPATSISEVEFGRQHAPGYAPFRRLIADPRATGDLSAWAGPVAPEPRHSARTIDDQATYDIEANTGGDLIGISGSGPFPADVAPFKEPATLAVLRDKDPGVRLPDDRLVGTMTAVNALSEWTYEIRYSSGIDLLVNTNLSSGPRETVLSELARQTDDFAWDNRELTYDLVTIGSRAVGVAKPGNGWFPDYFTEEDTVPVPGQVFWRQRNVSYHLYARSEAVTVADLMAVARAMIEPHAAVDAGVADSKPSSWPWWQALGVAAAVVVMMLAVILLPRRKTRVASPPEGVDG